ncbi:uncharacterized protein LAJ45_00490 [Morchella importuna]|uniref:Cytochrome P450 n=1 Tax=Morchella conica CCBAS932 TaxID=1392247 RepID=A0A3N4L0X8_9PEZI|nr:uncharacterized protein LAJ45_00490 [Morchella importuna]KAH8155480.1 hypothetical protein LAJ45_00490 [Morchella importuna]RPB16473.1 cytochrome P450 [Morchella conica CCBAS932]
MGLVLGTAVPQPTALAYLTPQNIAVAIIAFLLEYIIKWRFFGPLRHIPGPWWSHYTQIPDGYHLMRGERALYIHSLHERYGPTIRVGPTLVGVSGTAGVKMVYGTALKKPFTRNPQITAMFNFQRKPEADNIASFHLPGDALKRRRAYGNIFSRGNILAMQDVFKKCFENYFAKLETLRTASPNGIVPMVRCFRALALDAITEVSFGGFYKGASDPDHQMKLLDNLMSANLVQLHLGNAIYSLLKSIPWKRLDWVRSMEDFCRITSDSTALYLSNRAANPSQARKDSLSQLLSYGLPRAAVEGEALANVFAGTDTTGNSTAFIVCEVLKKPNVHRRVVEEVFNAFPEGVYRMGEVMEFRKVEEECRLLKWCIKEGMRRHSLAPGPALRVVPDDGVVVDGMFIPGKVDIFAQSHTSTHDPVAFPQPEEFIPDRWENETSEMRTLWTVFGSGPRICIGENLAMMEMQMMLALLFRNYELVQVPGTDMRITEFWLRSMKAGELHLKLVPRSV